MRIILFFLFLTALVLVPISSSGNTLFVTPNKSGTGMFLSISDAIREANSGDTIKVLPGNYDEQLNISKNIVIMGSGYEITKISSNSDPTIEISAGKIMWFDITSNGGNGINATGGIVTNCVIRGCVGNGIQFPGESNAKIINCCILQNRSNGVSVSRQGQWFPHTKASIVNSICRDNGGRDFTSEQEFNKAVFMRTYSNGKFSYGGSTVSGNIDADPRFVNLKNNDLHLSDNSPCKDTGNPILMDPDGSVSDMGYFGGPDAPISPIVTKIKIIPQDDGKFRIEATGIANW